jgi:hypothetical protein
MVVPSPLLLLRRLRCADATAARTFPTQTIPPYSAQESVQRMGTG